MKSIIFFILACTTHIQAYQGNPAILERQRMLDARLEKPKPTAADLPKGRLPNLAAQQVAAQRPISSPAEQETQKPRILGYKEGAGSDELTKFVNAINDIRRALMSFDTEFSKKENDFQFKNAALLLSAAREAYDNAFDYFIKLQDLYSSLDAAQVPAVEYQLGKSVRNWIYSQLIFLKQYKKIIDQKNLLLQRRQGNIALNLIHESERVARCAAERAANMPLMENVSPQESAIYKRALQILFTVDDMVASGKLDAKEFIDAFKAMRHGMFSDLIEPDKILASDIRRSSSEITGVLDRLQNAVNRVEKRQQKTPASSIKQESTPSASPASSLGKEPEFAIYVPRPASPSPKAMDVDNPVVEKQEPELSPYKKRMQQRKKQAMQNLKDAKNKKGV